MLVHALIETGDAWGFLAYVCSVKTYNLVANKQFPAPTGWLPSSSTVTLPAMPLYVVTSLLHRMHFSSRQTGGFLWLKSGININLILKLKNLKHSAVGAANSCSLAVIVPLVQQPYMIAAVVFL